jgi:hypothetical protein
VNNRAKIVLYLAEQLQTSAPFLGQFVIRIWSEISQHEQSNVDQTFEILDCLRMGQFSVMTNAGLTSPSAKKRLGGIDYLEDVLNYVMVITLRH